MTRLPFVPSRRHFIAGAAGLGAASFLGTARGQGAREVTHTLGVTAVTGKPQRVLVVSDFSDLEYTLALGVRPVVYGLSGAWARGALPWQLEAGADTLETFDFSSNVVSPEIIAGYAPDLIIGMSAYIESTFTQLQQIAPVIALDWSMPWRDGLGIIAAALDEPALAQSRIAETEALIATIAADLDGLKGKKIMIGSNYGGTLYVIGEGPIAQLFRALGLAFVPAPGANTELAEYSLENVDVLAGADILLSLASDPEATAALEALPTFRRLPAVVGRAYGPIDPVLASGFVDNFSPLSAPWSLPRLADLLRRLAAG